MFSESLVVLRVRPRGGPRTPRRKRRHVRRLGPKTQKDDAATTQVERRRTAPNGVERGRTAPPENAESAVKNSIFGANAADTFGTTAADPLRFTVFWTSQGEFHRYLRHSGHPKANSLAIYDTLGISGRIRSRFTVFWASHREFARYLRHSGHLMTNSLAIYGTLGIS